MQGHRIPYAWKKMPFVRLVIPLIAGILIQWYLTVDLNISFVIFAISLVLPLLISFLPYQFIYKLRWMQGAFINMAMGALGMVITYQQNIINDSEWIGHYYKDSASVMVTLQEPLITKPKSYKAQASVERILINGVWKKVKGDIIIYIQKDSVTPALLYGSVVVFVKNLQPIKNSGNPGAFDYARYNAFQHIHYQVYLKSTEYKIIPTAPPNNFQQWLLNIRTYVLDVIKKHIDGTEESGVAEALLIGYRNDLDKSLVQAYSNTGVVHIIAISGLHLGMIYGIMVLFLQRFKTKSSGFAKAMIMLLVLWIFCLVAGAAPSIVRSAVMFSLIIIGNLIDRQSSIFNTLAGAAFVMLCYNPFYFWDVGFQLSFVAVISIVLFMQPIYKWFYIKNKLIDGMWKLSAVTLSAQVLTSPLIFYYFHQFPLLFMITNFVAVPLSTLILYLELLLITLSPFEFLAHYIGIACSGCIWFMNSFIKHIDKLPFAVYDNVQVSLVQTLILFGLIIMASCWLLLKWKPGMYLSVALVILFTATEAIEKVETGAAKKLVVYNVPQHQAMDFVAGPAYQFVGDEAVIAEPNLHNFHLKPARNSNRLQMEQPLGHLSFQSPFIYFYGKTILVIDKPYKFKSQQKIPIDIIIIGKNPKVYISNLFKAFDCPQYVFDASNPQWKINLWKKDCDSLHLRHHSTPEKGAFVMEL